MIKNLLKQIYYFFNDILISIRNLNNDKNFIIVFPRIITIFFKKILIYDKINNNFFFQKVRNKFDVLTVFEIFAQESYKLNNLEQWQRINKKFLELISNNKKPLFIDCGSNIGSSCEYFSRIFKNIHSILIEPNKKSAEFSKNNISKDNYKILTEVVSSEIKKVKFDDSSEDNRSSKVSDLSKNVIGTTTIDDILQKNSHYEPFIIKIDIEGYEEDLFKKNYEWIKEFQVLIIEIHDWMIPYKSISSNFFNAINEDMKKNYKKDIIISGENLILIRTND